VSLDGKVWEAYGPHSCMLNVDEVDDVEVVWADISKKMGMEVGICIYVCYMYVYVCVFLEVVCVLCVLRGAAAR
jgi:tetrahydromethanopterin S-methyltransferase subunit G